MSGNPRLYECVQTCIVICTPYSYKYHDSSFSQVWMDFLFWIGSGKFKKFLPSQELGYGQKLVKVIISEVFIYLDDTH